MSTNGARKELATFLTKARVFKGMSHKDAAKKTGIPERFLRQAEEDGSLLPPAQLKKLCEVYEVQYGWAVDAAEKDVGGSIRELYERVAT